jgi:glycosyltransferase involved in cell wall biosynthesis
MVTVVIPTYNHARYVAEAIDSALAQTTPVEVVVVDDGSTDDTAALIAGRYGGRVRYVRQANAGLPAARNTGLRHASGDYLLFLDADDGIAPDCVARKLAILETRADLGWVFSDLDIADAEGRVVGRISEAYEYRRRLAHPLFEELVRGVFIHVHQALIRRPCVDAIGGFDETLRLGSEDWDFWVRMAARCRGLYLDVPLGFYRRSGTGMTANRFATAAGGVQAMERIEAHFPAAVADERGAWRRRKAELCLRAALAADSRGRWPRLVWVARAIRARPVQGRAYRVLARTLAGRWAAPVTG